MAEKLYDILNDNLTQANALIAKEGLERRVNNLAKLYNTKPRLSQTIPDFGEPDDPIIRVNKIYPNVRTAIASMFAKRPEVLVRPRTQLGVDAARRAELLLNYLTYFMKYPKEIRNALLCARLFHYGVVKLGMKEKSGMRLPSIEAWHPLSVRFDPHLEQFYPEEGRWCAFKFKRSIAALRASKDYKEEAVDKLAAKWMEKMDSKFSEEKTEIVLWEHIIKQGNKYVICTGEFDGDESVYIREQEYTSVCGLPVRVLTFSPAYDGWFPISPVEQYLDLQVEMNALFSQLLVHASRASRKYLFDKDKITIQEQAKFQSVEDQTFIACEGSPRDVVAPIESAQLNTDIYALNTRIDEIIMEISGIGSNQMGSVPDTGSKSATEAAIVQQNLSLRSGDNQEIFEEFLESIYQGVLNLAQAHMTGEIWTRVTNEAWMPVTKEDIEGDMDVKMSFGSTMPTDRQAEWSKAKELLEMFRGDPDIDQRRLKNYALQKQGDIKDVAEWFTTPMMPGMLPPGQDMGGLVPPMPPMGGEMPLPGSPQGMDQMIGMENAMTGASPLEAASDYRQLV